MIDHKQIYIPNLQPTYKENNSREFSVVEKKMAHMMKKVLDGSGVEFSIKSDNKDTIFNLPLYGKNENTSKLVYIPHYLSNKIRDYSTLTKDFKKFTIKIDFKIIKKTLDEYTKNFIKNKGKLRELLSNYETYNVFCDEFDRCLDLLQNIKQNKEYFHKKVEQIVTFLPKNQPLYAFACFAIIPSCMTKTLLLKEPSAMDHFFNKMIKILKIKSFFPNINISLNSREEFIEEISKNYIDERGIRVPVTDVVIFTGTSENAHILKKKLSEKILFITNGAGHNPIVITETGNIEDGVKAVIELQLYNQGQDCAAPNSILVNNTIYPKFIKKLKKSIKEIKVGRYKEKDTIVGPITDANELSKIQSILIKNREYIAKETPGIIDTKMGIIYPTIIEKPIEKGGNFTEQFSPIFFIQKYENDNDLYMYFENEKYTKNAMYITVYGYSEYVNNLIKNKNTKGIKIADEDIYLLNKHLHEKGVERGINPYGGYGTGASCISILGKKYAKPTLPQRDIYERLIKPQKESLIVNKTKINKCDIKNPDNHTRINQFQIKFEDFKRKGELPEEINIGCGISPSGFIHIGNLREFIVARNLWNTCQLNGEKTKLNFYRDDFDALRKVPKGFPLGLEKYIGMPLHKIPSPFQEGVTYGEYFKNKFKEEIDKLFTLKNINFISQQEQYESGKYKEIIITAIKNREKIGYIIGKHRTQKHSINEFAKKYQPIVVYSRFTGKCDTEILSYSKDKSIIYYRCKETNKKDHIDLHKDFDLVKLKRKIDWISHWINSKTHIEPGGADHSNQGGSYMIAAEIAEKIFGIKAPYYVGYEFVKGIGGKGKMSSSKGNLLTITDVLKLIPREILIDLYSSTKIKQEIKISMGLGRVIRTIENYRKKRTYINNRNNIFKKIVLIGNLYNWDVKKILKYKTEINIKLKYAISNEHLTHFKAIEEIATTLKKEQYIKLLDKPIKKTSLILPEYIKPEKIEKIISILGSKKINIKSDFISKQLIFSREEYKPIYRLLFGKLYGPNIFNYFINNQEYKAHIIKLLKNYKYW